MAYWYRDYYPSPKSVLDVRRLAQELDRGAVALNATAEVADGRADHTFATTQRVAYSDVRAYGKAKGLNDASGASWVKEVTGTDVVSDVAFYEVSVPANWQTINSEAVKAWHIEMVYYTGAAGGGAVTYNGTAAQTIYVRDNSIATGASMTTGMPLLAPHSTVATFTLGVTSFFTTDFVVSGWDGTTHQTKFQFRVGSSVCTPTPANMLISFRLVKAYI